MPTTTVTVEQPEDILPLEFLDLPHAHHGTIDDALPVLMTVLTDNQWGHAYNSGGIHGESYHGIVRVVSPLPVKDSKGGGSGSDSHQHAATQSPMLKAKLHRGSSDSTCQPFGHQQHVPGMPPSPEPPEPVRRPPTSTDTEHACFASHASFGILDLGSVPPKLSSAVALLPS